MPQSSRTPAPPRPAALPTKAISQALASFLDSPASILLPEPDRDGQRTLLEPFLEVCFDELGLAPRLLDRESMAEALGRRLPRRLKRREPLAAHAVTVLEAFLEFLEGTSNVPFAFEIRLGLGDAEAPFQAAVDSAETERVGGRPVDPFIHGADKLGRNDPCSCGSGKKFKKCHGRGQ